MLCFIHDGGRVLLLHRRKPPNAGQWDGVGGKLDPGEDPFAACLRETREETGLTIASPRLRILLVITVQATGHLWVIFVFTAAFPGGPVVPSDEGDLAWVETDRLSTLPVVPDVPVMLPHLFAGDGITVIREELGTEEASSIARIDIFGS